jgi:hypothetical protein
LCEEDLGTPATSLDLDTAFLEVDLVTPDTALLEVDLATPFPVDGREISFSRGEVLVTLSRGDVFVAFAEVVVARGDVAVPFAVAGLDDEEPSASFEEDDEAAVVGLDVVVEGFEAEEAAVVGLDDGAEPVTAFEAEGAFFLAEGSLGALGTPPNAAFVVRGVALSVRGVAAVRGVAEVVVVRGVAEVVVVVRGVAEVVVRGVAEVVVRGVLLGVAFVTALGFSDVAEVVFVTVFVLSLSVEDFGTPLAELEATAFGTFLVVSEVLVVALVVVVVFFMLLLQSPTSPRI